MTQRPTVQDAVGVIASACDGAVTEDGCGFNGTDTGFGRALAKVPAGQWTPRMLHAAWKMVRKYRGQLLKAGLDYDLIEEPPEPNGDRPAAHRIEARGDLLVLSFPYDAGTVAQVKGIPGRKWEPATKTWTVPCEPKTLEPILGLVAAGFDVDSPVMERVEAVAEQVERERVASRAVDAPLGDIPGLRGTLRPFQKAGVAYALRAMGYTLLVNPCDNGAGDNDNATRRLSTDTSTIRGRQDQPVDGALEDSQGKGPGDLAAECGQSEMASDGERPYQESNAPSRRTSTSSCGSGTSAQESRAELEGWQRSTAPSDHQGPNDVAAASRVSPRTDHQDQATSDGPFSTDPLQGGLRSSQDASRSGDRRTLSSEPSPKAPRCRKNGCSHEPWMARPAGCRRGGVILGDEPGLGKTIEALAIVQAARVYPALVICPASLKLNWCREILAWLPGKIVLVGEPMIPGTFTADIVVINYDVLSRHERGCRFPKEAPDGNACRGCALLLMIERRDFRAIILDEIHFLKEYKAKRTAAVKWLARRRECRVGLTGTLFLNRPHEGLSPLGIIGRLDDLGGFWAYASRYCGAHKTAYGWDMSGAANLEELNQKLRATCYVRRLKVDVLKELPAKQRSVVPVDITNRDEYERVEADVISYCASKKLRDGEFVASLRGQSPEVQKRMKAERWESAVEQAERAEHLVKIEALKQVAARGKMEAVREWVESFLESGEKLVLFAHHIGLQRELLAVFSGAARLLGEDDSATRQANVDRFQKDPDCRLIVCSLAAGGVGITLTAASNVAFVEFGWTPAAHDQAEDRCHRIGQTDQVTGWYLAAQGTIDTDILDLVEKKRAVVDAATEGRAGGKGPGILNELMARLAERKC